MSIGDLSLSSTMLPPHLPVQGLSTVYSTLLPRLEYTVLSSVAAEFKEAVDPKWVTAVLDIKRIVNPEIESYQFLMGTGFDILVREHVFYCSQCRTSCSHGGSVTACKHIFWLQDQLVRFSLRGSRNRRGGRQLTISADGFDVTLFHRNSGEHRPIATGLDIMQSQGHHEVEEFIKQQAHARRILISLMPISPEVDDATATGSIWGTSLELLFQSAQASWATDFPEEKIYEMVFEKMRRFAASQFLLKKTDSRDAQGLDAREQPEDNTMTVELLRRFDGKICDHVIQAGDRLSPVAVGEAVDALIYLLTAVADRRRLRNGTEVCRKLIRPPRRSSDAYFILDTLEQLPIELLDTERLEKLHGALNSLHNWAPPLYQAKMSEILTVAR